MTKTLRFSDETYLMIALHASKYPTKSVVGFLMGNIDGEQYHVTSLLPVCHSAPLGPILEIAAELAEKSCQSPNKVLGIYYAIESIAFDGPFPSYLERIITSIKSIIGNQAIIVQLKNTFLSQVTQTYLEATVGNNSPIKCETITSALMVNEKFTLALKSSMQRSLIDFEDHMNSEVRADYRIPQLVNDLKTL